MIPRLHYAPGSIAVASALALEEAGLDYAPVRVDFASAEQTRAAYARINPKGRVPALETDFGVLTETGAILEYIAAIAPEAGLVPDAPWQAGQMRAVMYYLASTMHVNHAHKMRGARWATQESSLADMAAKVPENMAACCAFLNEAALVGPFVTGDRFTLADAWLFAVCTWLPGDDVDIEAYPKLAHHFETVAARPSVQAVREKGILA